MVCKFISDGVFFLGGGVRRRVFSRQLLTFSEEPDSFIFSISTLKILAAASTKHLYLPDCTVL
jgi:hypothetical protein